MIGGTFIMRHTGMIAASCGLGLIFAWMGSLFQAGGLGSLLTGQGFGGKNIEACFLAVHGLTYLAAGILHSRRLIKRYRDKIPVVGCILMLIFPGLLIISRLLSPAPAVAMSGVLLAASGAALVVGRWGALMSSMVPGDAALTYGLSPLAAAVFAAVFRPWPVTLALVAAPVLSFALLRASEGADEGEEEQYEPLPGLPLWRLGVFLFCFYVANGFIISLTSAAFPGAGSAWGNAAASVAAAAAFRLIPGAGLRNFYWWSLPLLGVALFFLTFSPYMVLALLSLEGGLAFLDIYAWLLLLYFASRKGMNREAVFNSGMFIIVFATAASHIETLFAGVLSGGGHTYAVSLVTVGLFVMLMMLALWDGRAVYLWDGGGSPEAEKKEAPGADAAHEAEYRDGVFPDEKKLQMERRMLLMDYNLTSRETEIALLLLDGEKDASICSMLYISQNTLKYHLRNIYRKTGYSNRGELRDSLRCA